MHASYLLDVCSTFARCLFDVHINVSLSSSEASLIRLDGLPQLTSVTDRQTDRQTDEWTDGQTELP